MLGITALLLAGVAAFAQAAGLPFRDDFASGLNPAWRVLGGTPQSVAEPDTPGAKMIELTPGSKVMLQQAEPVRDLVIESRVRFAEARNWVEAPFLLRADPDGGNAVQVYLEQTGNQVMAVRLAAGTTGLGSQPSPVPLKVGPWYVVKIVAIGGRIAVWVDGKRALVVTDERPRAGYVGLRVGDACTDYADFVLRAPTAAERRQMSALVLPGRPKPQMMDTTLKLPRGGQAVLRHPDVAEPGIPFALTLKTSAPGPFRLAVGEHSLPIKSGVPVQVALSGPEGTRKLSLRQGTRTLGTAPVRLAAWTTCDAEPFTGLFERLRATVQGDRASHRYREGVIHTNPSWVRDHVHEMKAYQYWESDLNSFVDALISLQHPDGFFYEILTVPTDMHLTFVKPKDVLVDKQDNIGWVRLELEADVEYLMVEGAYHIWQATGDMSSMRKRLPHLERALTYCFTDPTRWDVKHGALKRPFTIDTWDFTYGTTDRNRRIDPDTPMGIMHGDNSGLYRACLELADMMRAAGQPAKARAWEQKAAALRERINRVCWNGRYYTHQVLLQPVDTGVKESDILSLSNTYDINRGLPTHKMAVSIIDEYRRRRALRAGKDFAEWFSIDPPYPQFGPYAADRYINGGIASFTAGELAKAALNEGREDYGVDILRRVAKKVEEDKAIYFLYTPDGKNQGGGPSGWGAAAVMSALVDGLAGIRDQSKLFENVTISPRFTAAGINRARVCARYGPSGAYVALDWTHRPAEKAIRLRLSGVARRGSVRVLLPEGVRTARLLAPTRLPAHIETIEQSHYLCFDLPASLSRGVFEADIRYGPAAVTRSRRGAKRG